MSHSPGQVRFNDGTIMHYEYNGYSDVVCNCLHATHEEMVKHWRKQPINVCDCGKDEDVIIFTHYGNGFYWEGKACKTCKAITDGRGEDFDECHNEKLGIPDWVVDGDE
ncbi:MAG: hypothetical protein GY928_11235 [Colwellia sp.]|nr:hypothetical protein [Colwellia sp.]